MIPILLTFFFWLFVWGQSYTSSFRALPTAASSAIDGVEQTPTVTNPMAVIAQDVCPGYSLSNVVKHDRGLVGALSLNAPACNVYGKDYDNLTLTVYYDSDIRLHVTIEDNNNVQYRVPGHLVGVPSPDESINDVAYQFDYNESPFEFWISRNDGEILFDTRGWNLVFETQYLELTTNLDESSNIYGLGEVIHSLRLHNNLTRTMWAK